MPCINKISCKGWIYGTLDSDSQTSWNQSKNLPWTNCSGPVLWRKPGSSFMVTLKQLHVVFLMLKIREENRRMRSLLILKVFKKPEREAITEQKNHPTLVFSVLTSEIWFLVTLLVPYSCCKRSYQTCGKAYSDLPSKLVRSISHTVGDLTRFGSWIEMCIFPSSVRKKERKKERKYWLLFRAWPGSL